MRCASGFCFRAIDVLIYISDIANAVPNKKVRLFADDSNLFLARRTAPSVADAANNTMFKLNNWFLPNKLSLNTIKPFMWYFHQIHLWSCLSYGVDVCGYLLTECREH